MLIAISILLSAVSYAVSQCDLSCYSCSSEQISQCTQCSLSYYYYGSTQKCHQTCPQGSYLDISKNICIQCISKNCESCDNTQCNECKSGYILDPLNKQNCISICEGNYVRSENGQCEYGCSDDLQFEIDFSTKSCIRMMKCPQFKKTPEICNKEEVITYLISRDKKNNSSQSLYNPNYYNFQKAAILVVDKAGFALLYSYPDLIAQFNYQVFTGEYQAIQCFFSNSLDLSNNTVTCFLSPAYVIKFDFYTGKKSFSQKISEDIYLSSFQVTENYFLYLSVKDTYSVNVFNYQELKSKTVDSYQHFYLNGILFRDSLNQYEGNVFILDGNQQQISLYTPTLKGYKMFSLDSGKEYKLFQITQSNYFVLYEPNQIQLILFNQGQQPSFQVVQKIITTNILIFRQLEKGNDFIISNSNKISLLFFNTNTLQYEQIVNDMPIINTNVKDVLSTQSREIIICNDWSIEVYSYLSYNKNFSFLASLPDNNIQLCNKSEFEIINRGKDIHIIQKVNKQIFIIVIDQNKQVKSMKYLSNFETKNQLIKYNSDNNNNFLLVNFQSSNQIVEVYEKTGIAQQFIEGTRQQKEQIQYTDTIKSTYNVQQLFLNFIRLANDQILFIQYTLNQQINIQIFQSQTQAILYEQIIPQIAISKNDFYQILQPIYFTNSDTILICIQKKILITDIQKRIEFHVLKKLTGSSDGKKYYYNKKIDLNIFSYLISYNMEYIIAFELQTTPYSYKMMVYDLNGVQKYNNQTIYVKRDSQCLGQVQESTNILYWYQEFFLISFDLKTLSISLAKQFNTQMRAFYFNPTFTYLLAQSEFAGIFNNFQVVTYTSLKQFSAPLNCEVSSQNDVFIFCCQTNDLIYYQYISGGVTTTQSTTGINTASFFIDNNVNIYVTERAILHYNSTQRFVAIMEDINLGLNLYKLSFVSNQFYYLQSATGSLITSRKTLLPIIHITNYAKVLLAQVISELQLLVEIDKTTINFRDIYSKAIITSYKFVISFRSSFPTYNYDYVKDIFEIQCYYHSFTNTIVVIFYKDIILFEGETLKMVFTNRFFEEILGTQLDKNNGIIYLINNSFDYLIDLRTRTMVQQKENIGYNPTQIALSDRVYQVYLNSILQQVIFCQVGSIRIYSIKSKKYISSFYGDDFNPEFLFYNLQLGYIIYQTKLTYIFKVISLSSFEITNISLPTYLQTPSSLTRIQIEFLDDGTYLFGNSDLYYYSIYDQKTHKLIYQINLNVKPDYLNLYLVYQPTGLIFFQNSAKYISVINYKLRTEAIAFYKIETGTEKLSMVFDSYKQTLIITKQSTFYIFNTRNFYMVYYSYVADFYSNLVVQYNRNKIILTSVQNVRLFDYSQLIKNNNLDFFQPKFFKINESLTLHISDSLSIITLYSGNQLMNQISLKDNRSGGILTSKKLQFNKLLLICDKKVNIITFQNSKIVFQSSYSLESKILKIIKDQDDELIIHLQSQKLYSIDKTINDDTPTLIIQLPTGLCQFAQMTTYIVFSDCINNNKLQVLQKDKKILTTIPLANTVVSIQILNTQINQVVVLTNTSILLFDLISKTVLKEVICNIPQLSVIKVDDVYKRIYLVNAIYDTQPYSYNLDKLTNRPLPSFETNIQLDQKFIYFISTHSANIFYRKDLVFMFNFRQFDISLNLLGVSYLNVEYLFLVQFSSKISIYEITPFLPEPSEKFSIPLSDYQIDTFSLSKVNQDPDDYLYSLSIVGVNFDGLFAYNLNIDIKNQQQQYYQCSQIYTPQKRSELENNSILTLNSQLQTLQLKTSHLIVKIEEDQLIKIPNLNTDFIYSHFDLTFTSSNPEQQVNIDNSFKYAQPMNSLKLQNLHLNINQQNPTGFVINPQLFNGIKSVFLENIKLKDIVLSIQNIQTLNIKQLELQSINSSYQTQLIIQNVKIVLIEEINISSQNFDLIDSIIKISECTNVTINSLQIGDTIFKKQAIKRILAANNGLITIFSLEDIDYLKIGEINLNNIDAYNSNLFIFQTLKELTIEKMILFNCKFKFDIQQNESYYVNKFYNIDTVKFNNQLVFSQIQGEVDYLLEVNIFVSINTILVINKSVFNGITISSQLSYQHAIIHLEYSQESIITNCQFQDSSNIGLLIAESYRKSKNMYQFNEIINLSNITIMKIINLNKLINIISISTIITQVQIKSINLSQSQVGDIISIQSDEIIQISQVEAIDINNGQDSLFGLQKSNNIDLQDLSFESIISRGTASCLTISDSQNISIKLSQFDNNVSNTNSGVVYFQNINRIIMDSCGFVKNKVLQGSGGAIYCYLSTFVSIVNNSFVDNEAKIGSGGAIYLNQCDILSLQSNLFQGNSAFIGGAIRYQQLRPLIFTQKNSIKQIKKQNTFSKNYCFSYGRDIGSYPLILDVKSSFEDDFEKGIAKLINIPSGYKLDEPLRIRFIDEEMSEIKFFDMSQYGHIQKSILEEFNAYFLAAESKEIGLLGDLSQSYKLDQFSFQFDLSFSYIPEKSEMITIKSTQPMPQFTGTSQQAENKLYQIQIEAHFRKCQLGEILQQQGKYKICYQCSQGFYNLNDPYDPNNQSCLRCPVGSFNCSLNDISVKNGYWRENNLTDLIVECDKKPENCRAEDTNSIQSCIRGHIGPLCQECDSRGKVWKSSFGKNTDLSCAECSVFSDSQNMYLLVAIFMILLAYIYFQIYKQISISQKQITTHYLIKMGISLQQLKTNHLQLSSHMKILLSYFQFLTIINSLNVKMDIDFSYLNLLGGDSSYQTISRVDCLLFQIPLDLPPYILRIFWLNAQPIILLIACQIVGLFVLKIRQVQQNRSSIYTSAIFIFVFFQPSIIKVLSESFSCEIIAGESYVVADLTQKCYGEDHIRNIIFYIIPIILFWLIIIPIFLLWRMHHYRDQFKKILVVYRYGFLYQEYRHEVYYWDIVRLYLRSLMIILVNAIRFSVILQALLITGLLVVYIKLQKKNSPYQSIQLNRTDRQQCTILMLTLYGLFLGYYFNTPIITYLTVSFVVTINMLFLIKMLKALFVRPIPLDSSKRNFIDFILMNFKQKFPYLFDWVIIQKSSIYRCSQNWNKVRFMIQSMKQANKEAKEFQKQSIVKNYKSSDQLLKKKQRLRGLKDSECKDSFLENTLQQTNQDLEQNQAFGSIGVQQSETFRTFRSSSLTKPKANSKQEGRKFVLIKQSNFD